MNSLLVSLSLLSTRSSNLSIVTWFAILFTKLEFRQFISIGSRTTSCKFLITKSIHSYTRVAIYRKSLEIRMEMTFLISNFGAGSSGFYYYYLWGLMPYKYFMSHSNILISQWTLISISSTDVASVRYFSKYFMWVTRSSFSQVKSLLTFLFSSNTWITIISWDFNLI